MGVNRSSHEAVVVNEDGMVQARDIIRMPVQHRWSDDCVNWVRWVPWHRYKGDEFADGDLPDEVSGGENEEKEEDGDRVVFIDTRDKVPRKFYISKKDAMTYGFTKGCPGCMSWKKGESRRPHTDACRERFAKLLEGQAKLENSKRMREFLEKELARERGPKRIRDEEVPKPAEVQRRIDDGAGIGD